MGVPSFYRWLVDKYPDIRVKAIVEDHEQKLLDSSSPNPNGIEYDNLYLDMNGIIHPCFHPQDHPSPPTTYEEVFTIIYEYIDHLFGIVRPRKLLYMATDGVAPRAKMNQQRSRRFRTAKDSEVAEEEEEKLRNDFKKEGKQVLPKMESQVSDSNVITPGTEFMDNLSKKLKAYIHSRMNTDPGWKDIQVILSDANVSGEGEHKIMSFIRTQRSLPGYNCNTRHCLYGLDADLIMLALALHEVHFSILREHVPTQERKPACQSASAFSHTESALVKKPYEFVHIWILRHYLELDMSISDPPQTSRRDSELPDEQQEQDRSKAVPPQTSRRDPELLDEQQEQDRSKSVPPKTHTLDLERIIDDFTFMCFFAGNDFLPHMPTLEIHEGCLDLLMHVYKNHFAELGGYLIDMQRVGDSKFGFIKLKRVEKFILLVGTYEEKIFKKRLDLRERELRKLLAKSERDNQEKESTEFDSGSSSALSNENFPTSFAEDVAPVGNIMSADKDEILRNTKELKQKLRQNLGKMSDLLKDGSLATDKVKLGIVGWRARYYKEKFSAETPHDVESIRRQIVQKYTEGLIWVLLYYFSGVPSWNWYYPYHYGPFASDLKGLTQVKVKFNKGQPFKPFDQLMGVLPARSAHALPKPYSRLMIDKTSSIIDFYPNDFEVDTDGKRFTWQGICKLPFIDEGRLLPETKRVEKELTKDEIERNSEKVDQFFVASSKVISLLPKLVSKDQHEMVKVDATLSGGIGGLVSLCDDNVSHLQEKNIISLHFQLPNGFRHLPRPLEGVQFPEMKLTEADIQQTILWHENTASKPSSRPLCQERYRRVNSSTSFASSSASGLVQNQKTKMFTSDRRTETQKFVTGSGWGRGRGRTGRYVGEQTGQLSTTTHFRGTSFGGSRSWYPRIPNAQPLRPTTNRSLDNSADQWRVGRGMEHLKVSESSHNIGPNTRQNQSAPPPADGSTQSMWFPRKRNENPSSSTMGRGQWFSKDDRNRSRNTSNSFTGNHGQAVGGSHIKAYKQ